MSGRRWLNLMSFLGLLLFVYLGVTVYAMYQRGLLTRETFDLLVTGLPGFTNTTPATDEEFGLSPSIQQKDRALSEESDEARQLASRLEMQRKELEQERATIERHLKTMKAANEAGEGTGSANLTEEMVKLVKMYEGMQPDEAAAVLENLPDTTVAQIVLNMRRRQASQIMASLSPNKAADVSKLLVSDKFDTAQP